MSYPYLTSIIYYHTKCPRSTLDCHLPVFPGDYGQLTLYTLCKFSADDILKYFSYFSQQTGFDISCKLSPKPTDLDLHCLPLSMWLCINSPNQVIRLAENYNWASHLINIFSMTRVNLFIRVPQLVSSIFEFGQVHYWKNKFQSKLKTECQTEAISSGSTLFYKGSCVGLQGWTS